MTLDKLTAEQASTASFTRGPSGVFSKQAGRADTAGLFAHPTKAGKTTKVIDAR